MEEILNEKQREAVERVEGPTLILAGAGSGKTRVVTCRIAYLLSIGIPASQILALTFTNKAAAEMRTRIEKLSNKYVLTSTFHSLGARILRESIHLLGYANGFSIYDEQDSVQLLRNCLKELELSQEKGGVRSLRSAISQAKNHLRSPSDIKADSRDPEALILQQVFTSYQQKLRNYNAVDFDDLLYLTATLLQEHEKQLSYYQERWSYILIDEYQDTNHAQYVIAKLLAAKKRNLFVVGDPDQSIYSWRGADIHNILQFEREYKEGVVITLDQNYRSTSTILKAANSLIRCNEGRYEKELWSTLGEGDKVGVCTAEDEREEAEFVIDKILEKRAQKGISLNECAIFYRTNAQSRSFEDRLLSHRLPYVIYGGLSFYQRREVKDILALLRMVVSNSDYLAFSRTINLPKRGIGAATLGKLQEAGKQHQLPILSVVRAVLSKGIPGLKLPAKAFAGLQEYVQIVDRLKEELKGGAPLEALMRRAIQESRYEQVLKEEPESLEERKDNLEELINKAAEWREEQESPSLHAFLEELSLKTTLDEGGSGEAIHLMTLHHGKGLEFPLVFIVGMEEDLFPHINAQHSVELLEEERRLCYVGMTRAKRWLYLTTSTYRFMWGQSKIMEPSRFLREISSSYLSQLEWV